MATMKISGADDRLHVPSRDPYWTEPCWFTFAIPQDKINGAIYLVHRPNLGHTVGGVLVWDATGGHPHDCLHWDIGTPYIWDDQRQALDLTLPSGLKITTVEQMRSYEIDYDTDECRLHLHWERLTEPRGAGWEGGGEEWATGHFEQLGRATGSLELSGRRMDIDCWSLRDRSWGPRGPRASARGEASWAASDRSAFLCFGVAQQPPASDPVLGTTDRVLDGWFRDQGEAVSLEGGEIRIEERDDKGSPSRVIVTAQDNAGRNLRAEGRLVAPLNCHAVYPWVQWWWSSFEWEINGQPAWGEHMELTPLALARRLARSSPAQVALPPTAHANGATLHHATDGDIPA